MRIAVFGDTGGHVKVFFNALKELGIDPYLAIIPEGLQIIHLGDLIHKGFSSDFIVETVDRLIRNNPGQWVQILGNHEFQHLGGIHFWKCSCEPETIRILNSWVSENLAYVAYGMDNIQPPMLELTAHPKMKAGNTSWLFTHAGLTHDWWVKLGKPATASLAAARLQGTSLKNVNSPGLILGYYGGTPGPVWAIGSEEVFPSWVEAAPFDPAPFSQMHGHTNGYDFSRNIWYHGSNRALKPYRAATSINLETKASITDIGNQSLLVSVDPCYDKTAYGDKQPYVLLETITF